MKHNERTVREKGRCFRPLTGICFSKYEKVSYDYPFYRFRPLTGICFSKYQYCSVLYKEDFKFPSPYGDMFF